MILNVRNQKPKISFGLGKNKVNINVGDSINLWVEGNFNSNYTLLLIGLSSVKVSDYQYRITPNTPGTYPLRLSVIDRKNKVEKVSSNITLIVT